jgi:hypothetical protein
VALRKLQNTQIRRHTNEKSIHSGFSSMACKV